MVVVMMINLLLLLLLLLLLEKFKLIIANDRLERGRRLNLN
jgi:hypothetical protein